MSVQSLERPSAVDQLRETASTLLDQLLDAKDPGVSHTCDEGSNTDTYEGNHEGRTIVISRACGSLLMLELTVHESVSAHSATSTTATFTQNSGPIIERRVIGAHSVNTQTVLPHEKAQTAEKLHGIIHAILEARTVPEQ